MSTSENQNPTSPESGEGEKKNQWVLWGLAIGCLVIFSITGPMTAVMSQWMSGGPPEMARLNLPSGETVISLEEYREGRSLLNWDRRFFGGGSGEMSTEEVLAYCTLRKLADDYEVVVSDFELGQYLSLQVQMFQAPDFETIWRNFRFRNALEYENLMRELMRVQNLRSMLAATMIPSEGDLLDQWGEDYSEMDLSYMVFQSDEFEAAAAALEPTEEEMSEYYPDGLTFVQRADLENEEKVAFEAIVISSDALATEVVQAWASSEAPSEDALQGFYDFRRFTLYMRSEDDPKIDTEPTLPKEELGDRLLRDYNLNRAGLSLLNELSGAEDLAAFAAEKGVEFLQEADAIGSSQLTDLPRIGSPKLREMAFAEVGEWMNEPIILDGLVVVARPTEQIPRGMPELVDVRESVLDFWRAKRSGELAQEAAQAFKDGIPLPEGSLEGDPTVMEGEAFATAVAQSNRVVNAMGWICRRSRPVVDPAWPADEKIKPWLRGQAGALLDDYVDGEVIGPFSHPSEGVSVVAHLSGRRSANTATIWPGEKESALRSARQQAQRRFLDEELNYEGLARAYSIEKVEAAAEEGY